MFQIPNGAQRSSRRLIQQLKRDSTTGDIMLRLMVLKWMVRRKQELPGQLASTWQAQETSSPIATCMIFSLPVPVTAVEEPVFCLTAGMDLTICRRSEIWFTRSGPN